MGKEDCVRVNMEAVKGIFKEIDMTLDDKAMQAISQFGIKVESTQPRKYLFLR
jgi:hypothetical protein